MPKSEAAACLPHDAVQHHTANVNHEPMPLVQDNAGDTGLRGMSLRFYVSVLLSLSLVVLSMSHAALVAAAIDTGASPAWRIFITFCISNSAWIQLALATPVVLYGGWPLLARGMTSLISRNFNMFTLSALGISIAYIYSLVVTISSQGQMPAFFQVAAVITTLALLGQVMELKARAQTGKFLRNLLTLAPQSAQVINADGTEEEMPLAHIQKGCFLHVRSGEKIPADGIIAEGKTTVDQSMITGESAPVEKTLGDKVIGATINGSGAFIMQVERAGTHSALARIADTISKAQQAPASLQKKAEAMSSWLVPAVILVAAATAGAWWHFGPEPKMTYALLNVVAVLMIACPCAFILAAPIAVMSGINRSLRDGILVKNAGTFEALDKIDTLIIDKTGTLTEGRPKLSSIVVANGFDEATILKLAASVEYGIEHPLAAAIMRSAEEKKMQLLPVTTLKTFPGKGMIGMAGGHKVVLGTLVLLRELSIAAETLQKQAEDFRHKGQTVIFIGIDGQAAGFLVITDPVRKTAGEAIRLLKDSGLRLIMLTGDNQTTADAIGRKLGIAEIEAGVTPERKAMIIRELQSRKHMVAMAGDSLNDAPALKQANIGITVTNSADVAPGTSGITLLRGDLMGIVHARHLSRMTMKNIRQNIFIAAAYNAIAIPLAAGALYPHFGLQLSPMIASVAMTLGSAAVIGNSLRLRSVKL